MQQITSFGATITIIHYFAEVMAPNGDGPPTPQHRIACMPNMTEFHQTPYHPNYLRSNEVRAVTCPACKKSELFVSAEKVLKGFIRG